MAIIDYSIIVQPLAVAAGGITLSAAAAIAVAIGTKSKFPAVATVCAGCVATGLVFFAKYLQ